MILFNIISIMEITNNNLTELIAFFDKIKSEKDLELEVRLWGKNFSNGNLNYYKYENILHSLLFDEVNGGFGLSDYTLESMLDISIVDDFDTKRLSIIGKDNIQKFWLYENLSEIDYTLYKKERLIKLI